MDIHNDARSARLRQLRANLARNSTGMIRRAQGRSIGRGLRKGLGVLLLLAGSFAGRTVVRGVIAGEMIAAHSHHSAH